MTIKAFTALTDEALRALAAQLAPVAEMQDDIKDILASVEDSIRGGRLYEVPLLALECNGLMVKVQEARKTAYATAGVDYDALIGEYNAYRTAVDTAEQYMDEIRFDPDNIRAGLDDVIEEARAQADELRKVAGEAAQQIVATLTSTGTKH